MEDENRMVKPLLVIGNKNYSSWSLRPWLVLKHLDVAFDELRLPLDSDRFHREIGHHSPSGRVPVLCDGALRVWDSLAICEYLAERYPEARLWPADPAARAMARSVCAEMHSGFSALRLELPMNCRARGRKVVIGPEAAADIARIEAIWSDCLNRHGGPWLFGAYSIADAFYAPVVLRFTGYRVALGETSRRYMATALADPALEDWLAAGRAETEVIEHEEVGGER